MTQIQIRRDTSSNWKTNNPVLASGEPAFETDTGKFKIGDGTTVYNSLDYIGDSELPSNVVTIDTTQTIDGGKTFSKSIYSQQPLRVDNINSYQSNSNYIAYNGSGQGSVTINTPNFCTGKNGSASIKLNTYNNTQYPIISSNSSTTNLMFPGYAWSDAFPNLELVATSEVSQLNMYLDPEVGNNVINVGRNKAADLKISRKPDDNTAAQLYTNLDTGNLQNNIIAGTNITTSVDDDGKVTINSTGGSSEPPANMVTTDTTQTITGEKTFQVAVRTDNIYNTDASEYLSCNKGTGEVTIGTSPNNDVRLTGHPIIDRSSSYVLDITGEVYTLQATTETLSVIAYDSRNKVLKIGNTDTLVKNGNNEPFLTPSNFSISAPTGALKYWTGTEAAYTEIGTKDPDTLYRTTDTNKVYLGTIQLGGS